MPPDTHPALPRRRAVLPRRMRVRKRFDFLRIQSSQRKASGRHLLVLVLPSERARPCRLGITVTRKVGNAVVRNRVKRWLREGFRRHAAQAEPPPEGFDLVVIARPSAASAGFEETRAELTRLMDRLMRRGTAL